MTTIDPQKAKRQMSSFDIAAIAAELRIRVGYRIEKVFHYPTSPMEMQFKINMIPGKMELVVRVGNWIYLGETAVRRPSENAERLSLFAQALRKHITNAKITGVNQHGFDRILEISLEQPDRAFTIIFEMFGSGNVALVENGTILALLTSLSVKDRKIKPGLAYVYPPSRVNLKEIGENEFCRIVKASDKDIVRSLALDLNLGGTYAEELCLRAGVDKDRKAAQLGDAECIKLHSELNTMIAVCSSGKYCEIILDGEGHAFDIQPCPLTVYGKVEKVQELSFNEGVQKYVKITLQASPRSDKVSIELDRLRRKLEQQRGAIRKIESEIANGSKIAESLYTYSEIIGKVITLLRNAKERKKLDSVIKALMAKKTVKSVDQAGWTFTIGIGEGENARVAEIDISKSFHENAGIYFDKVKKDRERLLGAKAAFEKTLSEIDKVTKSASEAPSESRVHSPSRGFWFEQYRWFISSGGIVVVAGRDAASNDKVVKKYLRERDRYCHADIHGAPSVVVKGEGKEISEDILREACEFALAFSKAWGQGIMHGSAYWVTPEQVSKTPNSGEYVPKGGFIIRGKKNFIGAKVECAMGEIEYESERLIMCGPVTALRSRSRKFTVFSPGEVDKGTVALELSSFFGIPVEQVLHLLPSGSLKIVERVNLS